MILLLGACFLLLITTIFAIRFSPSSNLPPGNLGWPIVGETLQFLALFRKNKAYSFFHERMAKHGGVFKTSLLGSPTIVMPGPDGNKFLFSQENKLVVGCWPPSTASLLGPCSLAVQTGQEHRRLREVFMTFLSSQALGRYLPKLCLLAQSFLQSKWNEEAVVTVAPLVQSFVFSAACNLFLSMDKESDQELLLVPFYKFVKGMMSLPVHFPGTRYYEALKSREAILRLLDPVISARKKELLANPTDDRDMLSVLLTTCDEDGKLISENEIEDNVLLMLFAGHETVFRALTITMKMLTDNPHWKEELYQEHLEIRASKSKPDYVLEWNDLRKMKLTWCSVQESMRLYPPSPGATRKATQEFEYAGYRIPEGYKLMWSVNTSRMKDEFFPEPQKFDPLRFQGNGPAPYVFTPFGGGPRTCPGNEFAKMEMLVFLHYLLLSHDWKPVITNEGIIVETAPLPAHGLPVKLSKR
ncbi:hypothetical protein SELMODRAFT_84634 [Selaginella moellendorffii]|uniref:Uncharacterized protein CYP716K1 n=1 Tax=Selaginella moellendorffii TaxID=88036 RepID=D8R4Q9_SELML|nr:cytochrome P450 716B1 [Selaginella moellendorffii]EFJ33146.1 hypothetical protein SELMODRAFT_84634 [Selaginella moellendorffii]|eukprot:XP_002965726.1 cytochrome P450 716B1 [Selaginella moellendorffii]